ncbi:MAG: hypothetical protein JXB88_11515 [Spirochaetales bacterium]|nr:hypothetical protein [Spirochaetales bacterium]
MQERDAATCRMMQEWGRRCRNVHAACRGRRCHISDVIYQMYINIASE